jgi:hypothetical protein
MFNAETDASGCDCAVPFTVIVSVDPEVVTVMKSLESVPLMVTVEADSNLRHSRDSKAHPHGCLRIKAPSLVNDSKSHRPEYLRRFKCHPLKRAASFSGSSGSNVSKRLIDLIYPRKASLASGALLVRDEVDAPLRRATTRRPIPTAGYRPAKDHRDK